MDRHGNTGISAAETSLRYCRCIRRWHAVNSARRDLADLLAVPVWLLFEIGLYFSGWFVKQKEVTATNAEAASSDYKPMSDADMEAELDRMENKD